MIIFGGGGLLGVVPAVLAYIVYNVTGNLLAAGIVLIAGGVGVWYLGVYMNKTRPARDLAARMDRRSAQLHAMADAGTFYRGPGYLPPANLAEAHQQANDLAIEEYAAIKGKMGNRHTLFWIPLQYWGIISGIVGLVLAIKGGLG
jgi:hypothetical protein